MAKNTIEERFSAALLYAEKLYGRGLQAKIAKESGVNSSNLNSIIRKGRGAAEETRRAIVDVVCSVVLKFPAKNYDEILSIGEWIIEGKNPEEWQPSSGISGGGALLPLSGGGLSVSGNQDQRREEEKNSDQYLSGVENSDYHKKLGKILQNPKYRSAIIHNLEAFGNAAEGDEEMKRMESEMKEMKAMLKILLERTELKDTTESDQKRDKISNG